MVKSGDIIRLIKLTPFDEVCKLEKEMMLEVFSVSPDGVWVYTKNLTVLSNQPVLHFLKNNQIELAIKKNNNRKLEAI